MISRWTLTISLSSFSQNQIDTVCLINPNNPNGGYVPTQDMRRLLHAFEHLKLVILDESFVDFAYEDEQRNRLSLAAETAAMPNVILVKSMSKDFGIAGVRAGYAIMSPDRVRALVANGYLWNIGGLAEFFFRLFAESEFQEQYAAARLRYLDEAIMFFEALREVERLHAYSTKANFCLVQLDKSVPIEIFAPLLLIRHGVYIRDCRDKIGLEDGQYVRIASRKGSENDINAGGTERLNRRVWPRFIKPGRLVRIGLAKWEAQSAVNQARRLCRSHPAEIRVCWDLDNTLANSGALIRVGKGLEEAVVQAEPVPNMLQFYRKVRAELPGAEHFILSARTPSMRLDTLVWLRKYGLTPTDGALCFVPDVQAKRRVWQQLARDSRLAIVDDLSYNHESDQPSIHHAMVESAEQTASVYVGFEQIAQIASDARAVDATAFRVVQSLVDAG